MAKLSASLGNPKVSPKRKCSVDMSSDLKLNPLQITIKFRSPVRGTTMGGKWGAKLSKLTFTTKINSPVTYVRNARIIYLITGLGEWERQKEAIKSNYFPIKPNVLWFFALQQTA